MAEHCECAGRLARLICRREAVQKRHLAGWQERPAGHYADCLEALVEGDVLLEGVLHVPGVGHRPSRRRSRRSTLADQGRGGANRMPMK